MQASIEWLTGVLRLHPEEGQSYQNEDDYEWAATVVRLDGGGITIKGVWEKLPVEGRKAIEKALIAEGFTHAEVTRHGRTVRITPRRNPQE